MKESSMKPVPSLLESTADFSNLSGHALADKLEALHKENLEWKKYYSEVEAEILKKYPTAFDDKPDYNPLIHRGGPFAK